MEPEYVQHAIKVAPPLTVSGFTLFGHPMQEWVYILTALYTVIQIGVTVSKFLTKKDKSNGG